MPVVQSPTIKPKAKARLTNMRTSIVALVDRPANKRKFIMLKSDGSPTTEEPTAKVDFEECVDEGNDPDDCAAVANAMPREETMPQEPTAASPTPAPEGAAAPAQEPAPTPAPAAPPDEAMALPQLTMPTMAKENILDTFAQLLPVLTALAQMTNDATTDDAAPMPVEFVNSLGDAMTIFTGMVDQYGVAKASPPMAGDPAAAAAEQAPAPAAKADPMMTGTAPAAAPVEEPGDGPASQRPGTHVEIEVANALSTLHKLGKACKTDKNTNMLTKVQQAFGSLVDAMRDDMGIAPLEVAPPPTPAPVMMAAPAPAVPPPAPPGAPVPLAMAAPPPAAPVVNKSSPSEVSKALDAMVPLARALASRGGVSNASSRDNAHAPIAAVKDAWPDDLSESAFRKQQQRMAPAPRG